MKLKIALLLFGFCSVAQAQYHCPHPSGQSWIVKAAPEKGCSDMLRGGELVTDDDVVNASLKDFQEAIKKATDAQIEVIVAQGQLKRMKAGFAALAKTHPKACSKELGNLVCTPVPGMAIRPLIDALELEHEGFVHTQRGRSDIYSYHTCRIHATAGKVTLVSC